MKNKWHLNNCPARNRTMWFVVPGYTRGRFIDDDFEIRVVPHWLCFVWKRVSVDCKWGDRLWLKAWLNIVVSDDKGDRQLLSLKLSCYVDIDPVTASCFVRLKPRGACLLTPLRNSIRDSLLLCRIVTASCMKGRTHLGSLDSWV